MASACNNGHSTWLAAETREELQQLPISQHTILRQTFGMSIFAAQLRRPHPVELLIW
jgi:hypothetical protein